MPFYIGQIGNEDDGFDQIREWFSDEQESQIYYSKNFKGDDKIYGFRKAESLAELLYEINLGESTLEDVAISNYNDLISKHGTELLKNEFPTESINPELFSKLEELRNSDEEAYYESLDDIEPDYSRLEKSQDINQEYPEDSDEGFWRIARDNG